MVGRARAVRARVAVGGVPFPVPVGRVPDGEPEVPGVEPELPGVEPEVLGVELDVLVAELEVPAIFGVAVPASPPQPASTTATRLGPQTTLSLRKRDSSPGSRQGGPRDRYSGCIKRPADASSLGNLRAALATHIIKVGILDDNFQIVIGITSRMRLRRGMPVDVPEMRPLACGESLEVEVRLHGLPGSVNCDMLPGLSGCDSIRRACL